MFSALMLAFAFMLGMTTVHFINHRFTEPVPRYMWVCIGLFTVFGLIYITLLDKS